MIIQIDSREKARAIKKIVAEFDRKGIKHPVSKLCNNVCQDHERFRRELLLAKENGIRIIFLVEHGNGIERLEHVVFWENPRRWKRRRNPETGLYETLETKAMTGETLYKILCTQERKYGCRFLFCSKEQTGKEIIRILGGEWDGS